MDFLNIMENGEIFVCEVDGLRRFVRRLIVVILPVLCWGGNLAGLGAFHRSGSCRFPQTFNCLFLALIHTMEHVLPQGKLGIRLRILRRCHRSLLGALD